MSAEYDRGPLLTYEVTWATGHVERIEAHQVILPMPPMNLFGSAPATTRGRVTFHGEINGKWQLILDAAEEDIRTIRNVSRGEVLS